MVEHTNSLENFMEFRKSAFERLECISIVGRKEIYVGFLFTLFNTGCWIFKPTMGTLINTELKEIAAKLDELNNTTTPKGI